MSATRPANSEILDRLPPCSPEAEKGVMGSMILDPAVCDDVSAIVAPDDFYSDANQRLCRCLLAMHDEGKRIDVTLLVNRLKQEGDFEAIGGSAYLAEVAQSVPYAANATHYAEIVAEKSRRRRIIQASTEVLRDAYSDHVPSEDLVAAQVAELERIATRRKAEVATAMQIMVTVSETIDRAERKELAGLPTGLVDVDQRLGGLFNEELIILAARPRMGKTAMATQIMRHVSGQGRSVVTISLEMSQGELGTRMVCARAGVDNNRIRTATLTQFDMASLIEALNELSNSTFGVIDTPSMTVAAMRAAARQHQRSVGLDLLIVDYLQRIQPADPRAQRHQQIGQITIGLKRIARELRIPVLCLAQLSREAEKGDFRPRLSHLRESGDIEADADVVLFLHRPEIYAPKDRDLAGKAELIVGKNRNGPTPEFELRWEPQTATFQTPARTWEENATVAF